MKKIKKRFFKTESLISVNPTGVEGYGLMINEGSAFSFSFD